MGDHNPSVTRSSEPTDPDTLRALDEEISRLPEALRVAVVLCELDGLSRKDAATRLGIAEGTLSSRLASARKQLAARLRGRGVALAVALALVSRAVDAAPTWTPTTSEIVSSLADGATRTMFLSKLKLTAMLAVLGVLIAGSGALLAAPPESPRERYQIKAPIPKDKDNEGVIAIGIQEDFKNRIDLFTPKGEKVATIPLDPHPMYHLALSRDGKRVAVWAWSELRVDKPNAGNLKLKNTGCLLVYDVDAPDKPLLKVEDIPGGGCVFAPDGKTAYLNELAPSDPKKPIRENTISKFDLKTQKKEKLNLPPDHRVTDVSPDGKTLLTVSNAPKAPGGHYNTAYLVPLDTLKPKVIGEAEVACNRFSPDGLQAIGRKSPDPKLPWKMEVAIVEVKDGKESAVKLEEDTEIIWNTAWSPDGKRILVQRNVLLPGAKPAAPPAPGPGGGLQEAPPTKPEVAIRKPDGSDPKPVVEFKQGTNVFGIDWR